MGSAGIPGLRNFSGVGLVPRSCRKAKTGRLCSAFLAFVASAKQARRTLFLAFDDLRTRMEWARAIKMKRTDFEIRYFTKGRNSLILSALKNLNARRHKIGRA